MSNEDRYSYEFDDLVATITLDDGKANAIQAQFLGALNSGLDKAEAAGAKAIVLTGRPGYFSAGLDLKTLPAISAEERLTTLTSFIDTMLRCYLFPVPIIAAVNGHALAGGAVLLCCCDFGVGTNTPAKIGLIETAIGIALPHWVIDLARATLDPRHWSPAMLHGATYSPQQAVEAGFLREIVDPDKVVPRAHELATELAKNVDMRAYSDTKQHLRGQLIKESRESGVKQISTFFGG